MAIVIALAAALGASTAAAAPVIGADRLPDMFVAACLDGTVAMSPGEASRIGVGELPADLRKKLGRPASGNAWRLSTADHSYLYVLNYPPGGPHDTRICGLASEDMRMDSAASAVDLRMNGYVGAEKLSGLQWLMPKDGYVATIARAGRFNVAQINWLSESGRAKIGRAVQQVSP